MPPELTVVHAEFAAADPWRTPLVPAWQPLVRATDALPTRLATEVLATWDSEAITFLFRAMDDHVVATYQEHDSRLYEEDVVEVFLAPAALTEYFEIEVSPRGTTFDARILSPKGVREGLRAEVAWTCQGLFAGVRTARSAGSEIFEWLTCIRMPFAALGAQVPEPGSVWRGNLFRIDRHPAGDEYSAWSPTLRVPADFHVAEAFGTLRFE